MKRTYAPLALAAMLAVSAPAIAQQPEEEKTADRLASPGYIEKQKPRTWLAVNFFGAPVKNAQGETVGHINNLLVHEDGSVEAALVGVGGVLGIGEKTIAVPFGRLEVEAAEGGGRAFVLDASKAELEKAAAFEQTEPSTSDKARDLLQRAAETMREAAAQMQKSAEEMTRKAQDAMKSGGGDSSPETPEKPKQ